MTGAKATAAAAAPQLQGRRQDSFIGGSKFAAAVDWSQSHSSSSSSASAAWPKAGVFQRGGSRGTAAVDWGHSHSSSSSASAAGP